MTRIRAIVLVVAGAGGASLIGHAQQPVFRSDIRTVAIYATVHGADGRLVTTLGKDDFHVSDNGQPAAVKVFSNETQPITVVAMLDTSGSMWGEITRVRDAALVFVDALWPKDRVRFGTFSDRIALSPLITGDNLTLKRIVREEVWKGGGSAVWNALGAAMASLDGEQGRRVVLTLSDGDDNCGSLGIGGCLHVDAVEKRVVEENFMVYAIDMQGAGLSSDLKRLSEESGGGQFSLKRDADLGAAFTTVVDELHHQYVLGFEPVALDGRVHKLEVRVEGLKVQTRKSYLAGVER